MVVVNKPFCWQLGRTYHVISGEGFDDVGSSSSDIRGHVVSAEIDNYCHGPWPVSSGHHIPRPMEDKEQNKIVRTLLQEQSQGKRTKWSESELKSGG